MKIIVPMAGMGKRMRPHTLTIPKPLIPIAGKPIVQRLVEEISNVSKAPIDEIAYIIGDFGEEVENELKNIAHSLDAKCSIYYQDEALGTAHAIYCAKDSLEGEVVIAFADTLFKADFEIDTNTEASIWVQQVDDPSAFGVVKVNNENLITDFIEKPNTFVSDLAIIGIYYFKDGLNLKQELKYLIDNKILVNGEYQLTDVLENMKNNGVKFTPSKIKEWMDCGNKNATVHTNQRILEYHSKDKLICDSAKIDNSIIIEPCYIGDGAIVKNSIVGPHVSIGANTVVDKVIISNSIVQRNASIRSITLTNSMIGNSARVADVTVEISVGDFTEIDIEK